MDSVTSESCYKGTILQRNYRRLTIAIPTKATHNKALAECCPSCNAFRCNIIQGSFKLVKNHVQAAHEPHTMNKDFLSFDNGFNM